MGVQEQEMCREGRLLHLQSVGVSQEDSVCVCTCVCTRTRMHAGDVGSLRWSADRVCQKCSWVTLGHTAVCQVCAATEIHTFTVIFGVKLVVLYQ